MTSAQSHWLSRDSSSGTDVVSRDPSLVDTVGAGASTPVAAEADEAVDRGSTIGRYLVVSRVGAGGMGVVFAAYDPDLDRRVALKVLRASVRRSRGASEGRTRLLREAQAMAKVQHENVIAVHDVGTIDDRVFIAMEFIDGETVGDWVTRQRPDHDAILSVFRQAGRGLAAAHARGLIHRDFKPDNVLRGHDGRVCVVDFGLARVSAPQPEPSFEVTDPGCPAATKPQGRRVPSVAAAFAGGNTVELSDPGGQRGPPVAAPSDERPLHDRDTVELSHPSASPMPPGPAAEPSPVALASDLTRTGAVVGTPAYMAPEQHLGAPATDRSDQFSFCVSLYEALYGHRPYAGANHTQLVVNLSEGRMRPVPPDARVPHRIRRVLLVGLSVDPSQRFASMDALLEALDGGSTGSRRRTSVVAVGAVGAALAAMALGAPDDDASRRCARAVDRLQGVWAQSDKARYSAAFMATDKPYARDAWTGVAAVLDDYTERWVAARIDACEATHVRGEQSPQLLDLRMACLDERLAAVAAVTNLFGDADAAVVETALDAVHRVPGPEPCSDRTQLIARDAQLADPNKRESVADERARLAEAAALINVQRVTEGRQLVERSVAAADELGYAALRSEAALVLADAQEAAGDLQEARASLRRGLLLAEAGGEDETAATAWIGLLWLDGYRGARYEAGHDAADHARALIARLGGDDELEALLVGREGDLAYVEGQYAASEAQQRRALALREALDGPDHPRTADSHTGIGHALVQLGRYPEALSHYDAALTIFEDSYGPRHPHLAHALTNVGVTQEYLDDLVGAKETHERALSIAESAYGRHHTAVAEVLNNYAAVLHRQGDLPAATRGFERAQQIWEATYVADHPDIAMVLHNLAIVADDAAEPARALQLHRRALAMRERVHGPQHPDVADSLEQLSELLLAAPPDPHALTRVEPMLRRALAIREATAGPDADVTRQTRRRLAALQSRP